MSMDAREVFSSSNYFQLISDISKEFMDSKEYPEIIKILLDCRKKNGTVFVMGCGGSASTATHFAADLSKTAIVKNKKRFKVISLVDNIPLVSAWTNDSGWGTVFSEQLEPWLTKNDVLVGFSVHGGGGEGTAGPWSQNLVQAMKLAKERGTKVVGFSGFDGGAMKKMADVNLIVPVDYEPYGTPAVEAFHVVLHHAIIFDIKEKVKHE